MMLSRKNLSSFQSAIESRTAILVVWSIKDLQERARYLDITMTFEQIKKVLCQLETEYDPNKGISFVLIDELLNKHRYHRNQV